MTLLVNGKWSPELTKLVKTKLKVSPRGIFNISENLQTYWTIFATQYAPEPPDALLQQEWAMAHRLPSIRRCLAYTECPREEWHWTAQYHTNGVIFWGHENITDNPRNKILWTHSRVPWRERCRRYVGGSRVSTSYQQPIPVLQVVSNVRIFDKPMQVHKCQSVLYALRTHLFSCLQC